MLERWWGGSLQSLMDHTVPWDLSLCLGRAVLVAKGNELEGSMNIASLGDR